MFLINTKNYPSKSKKSLYIKPFGSQSYQGMYITFYGTFLTFSSWLLNFSSIAFAVTAPFMNCSRFTTLFMARETVLEIKYNIITFKGI